MFIHNEATQSTSTTWTAQQRYNNCVLASWGSVDGTDFDIYYNGTNAVLDVNSGDLNVVIAGSCLNFQQATTITTSTGDLTINPAASLNVTLTVDDADALDLANDNASYYIIDTRNTVSGAVAHTFDTENATIASAATAGYRLASFGDYTLNYTGTTQVTSSLISIRLGAVTITGADPLTVDEAATLSVDAPIEGTNITLTDAASIRIAGMASGSPTNFHGVKMVTLSGATNNYAITIGNTDADQNLIHVGVTGDPVLSWDESEDSFASNKDIIPSTDGGADLGTQTNFQWANVWADLVNGSEMAMANAWRMMESELYPGYPSGWAVGYSEKWVDGISIWHSEAKDQAQFMEGERPVFAVTEDWLEYQGHRMTPETFGGLQHQVNDLRDKVEALKAHIASNQSGH